MLVVFLFKWKKAGTLQVRVRQNANENHVLECVMLCLSKIVSTLTIQEFRESRINDISGDRPTEYYINEILSSRDKNIDAIARCPSYRTSTSETEQHVSILRIEDIIGVGDSRIESVSIKSKESRISHGRPAVRSENFQIDEKITISNYKKVFFKDYLWRGDWTRRNPLFQGMEIGFQHFYHSSVPTYNDNHKNGIVTWPTFFNHWKSSSILMYGKIQKIKRHHKMIEKKPFAREIFFSLFSREMNKIWTKNYGTFDAAIKVFAHI